MKNVAAKLANSTSNFENGKIIYHGCGNFVQFPHFPCSISKPAFQEHKPNSQIMHWNNWFINPLATVHTLRHSFATHLLEKGVGLRYLQDLLGHGSSKTTETYSQLTKKNWSKAKSPLYDLDI